MKTVNSVITHTYYEIGRRRIQEEQGGENRAQYGKKILDNLSKELTREFGKGFSVRNLKQMRRFYQKYSIRQTASAQFKLSWSHYIRLCRIDSVDESNFYEIEAINNNWSLKELDRQFNTGLYDNSSI